MLSIDLRYFLFFFNVPAPTDISTLSLHDALPIYLRPQARIARDPERAGAERSPDLRRGERDGGRAERRDIDREDRKSTRLNSSHPSISYAVFCLKKKNPTISLSDSLCSSTPSF